MKLLPEMLAEWVQTSLSPQEVGDLLTMTGFELEEIIEVEGEPVLDINIMANRGDGASVLGLAREVNAKVGGATDSWSLFKSPEETVPPTGFRIESPLCDGFATLAIKGVSNGPSPEWFQRRLIKMGQRPRSLLVDLTNYVMLEVGQPLHAYDADRLNGPIVIREATAGEKVTTLDEIERELKGGELLITDGSGPIGLAGIMGGASTEVHEGTTRTIIEAAHFDAQSVRATRKAQGMFTEASYRFERSVDPTLPARALRRFAHLYQLATRQGLRETEIEMTTNGPALEMPHISFRPSRATRLLGYPVDERTCARVLVALGCQVMTRDYLAELELPNTLVSDDPDAFIVVPPTWRPDLLSETDLVEEVGRINGYEKIPAILPQGTTRPGGRQGYEAWRQKVLDAAIAEGFQQIVGHSLVPEDALGVTAVAIGPRVPASPEHRLLRTSLWTSLGMAARRGSPGSGAHLVEIGRTFTGIGDLSSYLEHEELGLLSVGPLNPPGLKGVGEERADFPTLKGALNRILRRAGIDVHYSPSEVPRLHPTRQARLMFDGNPEAVGEIGQIHPRVAAEAGLPEETLLASLDLRAAYASISEARTYRAFARTPGIRRDLAIVAERDLPFAQIDAAIRKAGGDLLERLWVFDLYEGPNVGEGKKSVGVAIELRKPGATFTDEEANRVRDAIAAGLEPLGAMLRV